MTSIYSPLSPRLNAYLVALFVWTRALGSDTLDITFLPSGKSDRRKGGIVKALVAFVLILFSFVSVGHADESFTAFGSTIGYGRPDSAKWNLVHNGMDEKSKAYLVVFEHTPIKDAEGHDIKPVIAIVCESVPETLDVIQYSISKRAHTPFEVTKMVKHQDGSFEHRNSVGYEGTYRKGVEHKVLVAHMRHGSVGLQAICDSTDGVYGQVEADMRSFLRSITFKE